jgi:hypothetical protein
MLWRAVLLVALLVFVAWLVGGVMRDRTRRGRRRHR